MFLVEAKTRVGRYLGDFIDIYSINGPATSGWAVRNGYLPGSCSLMFRRLGQTGADTKTLWGQIAI